MSEFKKGQQPAQENASAMKEVSEVSQGEAEKPKESIQNDYTFDEYDAYSPWE